MNYKINIEILSSFRTALYSDTIFGHLCWAYRYIYGEDKLKKWLDLFSVSPTLISNAFPRGYLPRPFLPMPDFADQDKFDFKKLKKQRLLSEQWFVDHINNFSSEKMHRYLIENMQNPQTTEVLISHNAYNRLSGKVKQGGLFDTSELFSDPNNAEYWFLISSDTLVESEINSLMKYISYSGFGADKSTGKGQFRFIDVSENTFPVPEKINAILSLSNFVPATSTDVSGFYRTITKYGKLGGQWATGYNPFKKPVIMLESGTIIPENNFNSTNFYGKMVENIHFTNPDIVHYGLAYPIAINLAEDTNVF